MSNFLFESINLTNEIIKDIGINEADFYNSVLLKISSLYKESLLAVYFLENTSYSFKAGIKNQKKIKSCDVFLTEIDIFLNSDSNFISLKTKQNEFLNKNTLLVKLAIKDSVFGFLIFSINEEISKEKLEAFISISNISTFQRNFWHMRRSISEETAAISYILYTGFSLTGRYGTALQITRFCLRFSPF